MAQGVPPLHYLSQLYPLPALGFDYQDPEAAAVIPQRAAAPFYDLPPLERLLQPGVADAVNRDASPTDLYAADPYGDRMPRPFNSLFPGHRESANVEDRRGRFDDLMYAKELDQEYEARRSAGATPLMRRR